LHNLYHVWTSHCSLQSEL